MKEKSSKGRNAATPNVLKSLNTIMHTPLTNNEKLLLVHGVVSNPCRNICCNGDE